MTDARLDLPEGDGGSRVDCVAPLVPRQLYINDNIDRIEKRTKMQMLAVVQPPKPKVFL